MKWIPESKKWRALLIVTAASLVGLCTSGWIVSLLLDLPKAREEAVAELSRKLHRQVKIGRLSVGFFSASLSDVSVADREGFGDEPFVTLRSAKASVHPLKLLQGRLVIEHIKAQKPVVVIKRDAQGELNVSDFLRLDKSARKTADAPASPKKTKPDTDLVSLEKVDIAKVILSHATVKLVEMSGENRTVFKGLSVRCEGDLSGDPIKVRQARIGFQKLAIQIRGDVSRDAKRGWVAIQVADVDLMSFKPYLPFLSGFETGRWVLQDISLKGRLRDAVLEIENFSCRPSGGKMTAAGKIWMEDGKPAFQADAKVEDFQLEPMLWQTRADKVSFGGVLDGSCSLTGKGLSWADLAQELLGSAELRVNQGRFQNKIFLKIGEEIRKIVGMRAFDEYRAGHAHGRFEIGQGRISSSDLRFDSKTLFDVYLTGAGYVAFDGELRMSKVTVRLGDERESVEIPIKIRGTVNKPKVDFEFKALKKALIGG